MRQATLSYINTKLKNAGVNYALLRWSKALVYPYWIGEYSERDSGHEDGGREDSFILSGTAKSQQVLEEQKALIIGVLKNDRAILSDGSGVVILFESAYPVPTGAEELKRIQINFSLREWETQ